MPSPEAPERPVPWRTIWAVIGSVAVTYLGYKLALQVHKILLWLVVALFFAVVLAPAVSFLEVKARLRRGLAVMVVMLIGLALIVGMLYSFVRPLADQATAFAKDLPTQVADARDGKGAVGDVVRRFNLEKYVKDNQDKLQKGLTNLGAPALGVAKSVFNGVAAVVTIFVLTILMLLQGPSIVRTGLELVPDATQGAGAARARPTRRGRCRATCSATC